jgi:uncharacterized membrane protein YkvA (DUF1232 family)
VAEKISSSKVKEPGFWAELWQQVRLIYYLIRDPDVPLYLKLVPLLAVGYLIFPIDALSDFFPVVGQLDDLTVLLIGAKVFIELVPQHIVARYQDMLRQGATAEPTVIDNPESLKNGKKQDQ